MLQIIETDVLRYWHTAYAYLVYMELCAIGNTSAKTSAYKPQCFLKARD